MSKNLKKTAKKTSIFLCMRFYTGRKNFYNKNCLFDAKFFEFEEFSIVPFFVVASSLSILCDTTRFYSNGCGVFPSMYQTNLAQR